MVKNAALYLVYIVLSLGSVYSQDTENSEIVLFRAKKVITGLKVYSNDSLLTNLRTGAYSIHHVKPGDITLTANDAAETTINLRTEKGKTYYVQYTDKYETVEEYNVFSVKYLVYPPTLSVVDSAEAVALIEKYELRNQNNPELWKRPKLRFDICLNAGIGIKNIPIVELDYGGNSIISFAEMLGAGCGFTYELFKYFNLSTNFNYCASQLLPDPKNVDVRFKVCRWSFTPYLVIPFDKGSTSLKIGIGKDYYFSPSLSINTSEIQNGFDDVWFYNNANGYHISILYDIYNWTSCSLTSCFKWYNVKY
ncbi:MAG: hypothetical protein PHT07_24605, partial [Paludibacter sp.]|nr:hypothetical protein [Paludibacter sp.]